MQAADFGPIVLLMVLVWVLSAVFGKKKPPGAEDAAPESPGVKSVPKGLAAVLRQIESELRKQAGAPAAPPEGAQLSPRAVEAAARGADRQARRAAKEGARPIAPGSATAAEHERSRESEGPTISEHERGEGRGNRPSPAARRAPLREKRKKSRKTRAVVEARVPQALAAPSIPREPATAAGGGAGAGAFALVGANVPDAARAILWSEILREPCALRPEEA